MRWTHENCFHPVSQRTEQPASHECGAGDRPAGDWIPEETDRHGDSRWDIPRKRVLFTSDGTDSTTCGSNTPESHADWPRDVEYSEGLMTELERAMMQLQKDSDNCHTEFEITRMLTPAVDLRAPRQARFTSTPVPRYSGKSNWDRYREIVEVIVCLNGWDDVTAALQLVSHLDGDAINVALMIPESWRVVPGFLLKPLSDHDNSPGRLAEYKRQFQRVVRRPMDDPSIFAIELETLARRALIDIDISIQLQMVCDRFIDGQVECALRRHLDSLGPDTPMAGIVDCCRVWESHRDVETEPRMSADRCPTRTIFPVTEVEPTSAVSPEINKLLPMPAPMPLQAVPIRSDQDLRIQQLMEAICPPTPGAQQ